MNTSLKLPANYMNLPIIQIAWNGWFREQCTKKEVEEKHKECALILSLVYDPGLRRLRPIESSQK